MGFNGLVFPTRDTPIDHLSGPVFFVDAITTVFARQGSWTMPPDITYIGFSPQPSRDALTPSRVAVLKILPRHFSTMQAVERNKTILVPHVDGRKIPKPGNSLTAPEILRTFATQSTSGAKELLKIMTNREGEAWPTA